MRPRPRAQKFLPWLAAPGILGLALFVQAARSQPPGGFAGKGMRAVAVAVATVHLQDVEQFVTAVGTVQSLQNVVLRSQIDGVLTDVAVREGQPVKRGQLLATIDDRAQKASLAQALATKARDEANLRIATLDLKRDQNLLSGQAISRQTVDQQSATVEQLRATVLADDAAVQAAQVQLSYTRILSPVTGRVGLRRVDAGNLVHATDAAGLFSVLQVDPISVTFSFPQQDLRRIQPLLAHPEQAEVTVTDRDTGSRLAVGRLMTFDNQIDSATGTFELRGVFANAKGLLLHGEFVTVQLRTGVDKQAMVVDARALQQREGGQYVFRIVDGRARVAAVTVGVRTMGLAEISSGLKPGDSVVIDGQSQLMDGTPVRIIAGSSATATAPSDRGIELQP